MPQGTQAEIFIETLAELLAEDRARKAARSLRLARAQADRFMSRSFVDDPDRYPASSRQAARVAAGLPLTL